MSKGLIHIYHGQGKGKTTCGFGLCTRALGSSKKVLVHQFLKNNNANERKILEKLDDIVFIDGKEDVKFIFNMNEQEIEEFKKYAVEKISQIIDYVEKNDVDVLFLDEILHLFSNNIVKENDFLNFLKNKPEKLEIILTGYNPSQEIIKLADYISHIEKQKHPFDKGIKPRNGIEF